MLDANLAHICDWGSGIGCWGSGNDNREGCEEHEGKGLEARDRGSGVSELFFNAVAQSG